MLDSVQNNCEAYADDTKILSTVNNFDSIYKLQSDMDKVCKWSKEWSTQLNVEKCKVVHIGSNNPESEYKIGLKPLSKSKCERDLGIYIQNDLKWDTHVKNATAKANRMLGIIRKAFKYSCRFKYQTIVCSMVRTHLEYLSMHGVHIWKRI